MESQFELAHKAGSLACEIKEIEGSLKRNHQAILELQHKAGLLRDQKFDAERMFAETMNRLVSLSSRDLDVEMPPAFVPPGMQKSAQAQEESLTGNSLNRVFEDHPPLPEDIAKAEVSSARKKAVEACRDSSDGLVHAAIEQTWNDLRGAFVGAHRDAMNFGQGLVCISSAGDEITATRIPPMAETEAKACIDMGAKAVESLQKRREEQRDVQSQQSVGPVAGALHPFRELGNDEFVPCKITHPAMIEACDRLLKFRRDEFDEWLKQHDLELINGNRDWYLRSMSAQEAYEARNWVARRTEAGCGGIEAIRSAFDDLMLKRKGS